MTQRDITEDTTGAIRSVIGKKKRRLYKCTRDAIGPEARTRGEDASLSDLTEC